MARSPLAFITVGAGVGLAIPLIFRLLYVLQSAEDSISAVAWTVLDYIQLMLWPTPLLLVPTDEPGAADLFAWGPFTVTALANVTLYGVISALLWAGVARSRPLLIVPAALIGAIWYAVWRT